MKNLSHLITFILLLTAGSFFGQNPPKEKRVKTLVVKTTIYCDHCKECESCGGRILKKLYNENGIKSTEVNQKAQTITVVYDSQKITVAQIRESISKMGFDADEVKADPVAVAKLDDCCKKN